MKISRIHRLVIPVRDSLALPVIQGALGMFEMDMKSKADAYEQMKLPDETRLCREITRQIHEIAKQLEEPR